MNGRRDVNTLPKIRPVASPHAAQGIFDRQNHYGTQINHQGSTEGNCLAEVLEIYPHP